MMFGVTTRQTIMAKNTNLAGQPVLCQLLSFLPREIVADCVLEHESDRYYKTMTTFKQLTFMMYGVVAKCYSLQALCKNLLFLEDKLIYLGIDKLPAVSTLSDANVNRNSVVFASIYKRLVEHYKEILTPEHYSFFEEGMDISKVVIFDSSTISLFVEIFKGAGRNSLTGKKKGGLKIHTQLPLGGFVPDMVYITEAACSDKSFLGQLVTEKGAIYVFDKGYVNYKKWKEWSLAGAFFVTRLNENAVYEILSGEDNHPSDYADGGIISDQVILLDTNKSALKARLIVWKDFESGIVLEFISNMFDYQTQTIIQLYKYRWSIETWFKQLKQNFELGYFYSDSSEGIKTQIWIALIANLLFSVIHRQCKESESFVTIVSLAATNMGSYTSLIKIVRSRKLTNSERDLRIVQLDLYEIREGGVFEKTEKSP
jgi:hypothetical protein